VALESDQGRRFNELVDRYLASPCHDENAGNELRAWLVRWRDNDAALQTLAQRSFLVQEIVPVSQDLAVAAKIGVEAMDYLILGTAADAAWKTGHVAALSELAKPKAQLLLMPLPGIQKLVEATNAPSVCGAK
jgi:hexosaminidase